MKPVIFLTFANDPKGEHLESLLPEQDILQSSFIAYKQKGWGDTYTSATSDISKIRRDLNKYRGQVIIFHFGGHNKETGLQLRKEDGKSIALHKSGLVSLLARETKEKLKLVFLNGCATEEHVQALQDAGVKAIIATNQAVKDKEAKEFSVAFYDSLISGASLKEAFNEAQTSLVGNVNPKKIVGGIDFFAAVDAKDKCPWVLCNLEKDKEVLDWKLEDDAPKDTPQSSYPKELNTIPGINDTFIGREQELEDLQEKLQGDKPLLLLKGLGGIGKTTLAREYLRKHYDSFDHITWVSVLFDPESEKQAQNTSIQALGNDQKLFKNIGLPFQKETPEIDRAKAVLEKLKELPGQNLLIIDNAGEGLLALYDELPQTPNWQVLVSSRQKLGFFDVYELDTLSPDKALELFARHYPDLRESDPSDAEKLLKHVGYHTLTVELFAKTCESNMDITPAHILQRLQNKSLDELEAEIHTRHAHDKRKVEVYGYLLEVFSMAGLSEAEESSLLQWAVMPSEELGWDLIKVIFQASESKAGQTLGKVLNGLSKKGWLIKKKRSFRMHQLMQEVIRYKLKPTAESCKEVIQGITSLVKYDLNKDNPAHFFEYLPLGDSLLEHISAEGKEIAFLQSWLGFLYRHAGNYPRALELKEATHALQIKIFGEDHHEVAAVRSDLGSVYKALGQYDKAKELYEKALTSGIKNFGEEHPKVALRRNNLGGVYYNLGQYVKAIEYYEMALASDLKNFGEEHPLVAIRWNNLGGAYDSLGQYDKAIELYEKALASDIKNFGEEHPKVAIRRNNLGNAYRSQGDYNKAAEVLELALKSDLKNFGEEHPGVATTKFSLGAVYLDMGRKEEGRKLLQETYQIYLNALGPEHPNTKNVKGWLESRGWL